VVEYHLYPPLWLVFIGLSIPYLKLLTQKFEKLVNKYENLAFFAVIGQIYVKNFLIIGIIGYYDQCAWWNQLS
jgi:hypothetical protein